jgi:hypothetical protein
MTGPALQTSLCLLLITNQNRNKPYSLIFITDGQCSEHRVEVSNVLVVRSEVPYWNLFLWIYCTGRSFFNFLHRLRETAEIVVYHRILPS